LKNNEDLNVEVYKKNIPISILLRAENTINYIPKELQKKKRRVQIGI